MLEVFGIVFVEEVLDEEMKPWSKNVKKLAPIVILRQLTKSVTN